MEFRLKPIQPVDLAKYTVDELISFLDKTGSFYTRANKLKYTKVELTEEDVAELRSAGNVAIISAIRERYVTPVNVFGSHLTVYLASVAKVTVKGSSLTVQCSETDDAVIPLCNGYPVPDKQAVQKIKLAYPMTDLKPTIPSIVTLACTIADLATYVNGSWRPKAYSDEFCDVVHDYREVSVDVCEFLAETTSDTTKTSKKGSELVDYLIQILTKLGSTNPQNLQILYTQVMSYARPLSKHRLPNVKQDSAGYAPGTVEYALHILSRCRGIRGGDDSDSSVLNSSFYLPVTVPRQLAKAAIFVRDICAIKGVSKRSVIELTGPDSPTYLSYLVATNMHTGLIIYKGKLSADWTQNSEGYYKRMNTKFSISKQPVDGSVVINCLGAKSKTDIEPFAKCDQFITCTLAPEFNWANFLPSISAHSLYGFYNPVMEVNKIDRKKYCLYSVLLNLSRTFFTTSNATPKSLAASVGLTDLDMPEIIFSNFMKSTQFIPIGDRKVYEVAEVLGHKLTATELAELEEAIDHAREEEKDVSQLVTDPSLVVSAPDTASTLLDLGGLDFN